MIPIIPKTIALIGTFDTKGEEFSFLRDRLSSDIWLSSTRT